MRTTREWSSSSSGLKQMRLRKGKATSFIYATVQPAFNQLDIIQLDVVQLDIFQIFEANVGESVGARLEFLFKKKKEVGWTASIIVGSTGSTMAASMHYLPRDYVSAFCRISPLST